MEKKKKAGTYSQREKSCPSSRDGTKGNSEIVNDTSFYYLAFFSTSIHLRIVWLKGPMKTPNTLAFYLIKLDSAPRKDPLHLLWARFAFNPQPYTNSCLFQLSFIIYVNVYYKQRTYTSPPYKDAKLSCLCILLSLHECEPYTCIRNNWALDITLGWRSAFAMLPSCHIQASYSPIAYHRVTSTLLYTIVECTGYMMYDF